MINYDILSKAETGNEIALHIVEKQLNKVLATMPEAEKRQLKYQLLQKKAEYGSAKGRHAASLALRYVLHEYAAAFSWMKKAAEGGYHKAIASLGADYFEGIPGVVEKDPGMARWLWNKEEEAKADDADIANKIPDHTVYRYFHMAESGESWVIDHINRGTGVDYATLSHSDKVFLEYDALKAAAIGSNDAEAKYRLFYLIMYQIVPVLQRASSDLVPGLVEEALDFLTQAAEDGHITAMVTLQTHYELGLPRGLVEADAERAQYWKTSSILHGEFCEVAGVQLGNQRLLDAYGNDEAPKKYVGEVFGRSYNDITESEKRHMEYYAACADAERGDAEAQYFAGYALLQIHREEEGLLWLQKAVDNGSDRAAAALSFQYQYGIPGVLERDVEKSEAYRRMSKELEQSTAVSTTDSAAEAVPSAPAEASTSAPTQPKTDAEKAIASALEEISTLAPAQPKTGTEKKRGLFSRLFGKN